MEKKKSFRIMLIDKDKHIRESLRIYLDYKDMDMLVFKSGQDGLNALKYQDIDVIISDYSLPDMSGIDFFKQITAGYPDIIKIMMATLINENLETEAQSLGILKFLEKPLSVTSIEQIIKKLIMEKGKIQLLSEGDK